MAEEHKLTDTPGKNEDMSADMPLPDPVETEKEPAINEEPPKDKTAARRWQRFIGWYKSKKKLSIPLTVLVLLTLLLIIPLTRYPLAGIFIKKDYAIEVADSVSNTAVSGASVSAGSVSVLTDGNGKAVMRLSVGHHGLVISKKYYQDRRVSVTVPLFKQKTIPLIAAVATGRQVNLTVKDAISKKLLAGVDIKVLDVTAKTDKNGNALLVLPADSSSQKASLSLSGYNNAEATIKISNNSVAQNDFTITPAGKVYFLSKLSGKIDVVKTDLDGQNRATVLAGTGKEEDLGTVLLASRDWKYLALLSRRDSDLAKLYLIETGSDKVTAVDEGNANFNLIGWAGSNFIYQVDRLGYANWQPKAHALKSYNAQSKQIILLDETSASGSSNFDYASESFNGVFIVGQRVVYTKSWYPDFNNLSTKTAGIYSIGVQGGSISTHKTLGYATGQSTYVQSYLVKPDTVYFQVVEKSGDPKYFVYAAGQVAEDSSIKDNFQNYLNGSLYNTYLISPSGQSTFWSESRDGKNTLFVGDNGGNNGQQVASLSDYQTYGWYTDSYLLVSKNGSELYVMGIGGIKKDGDALKIADYHKPAITYPGYGGGYGGL